MEPSGPIFCLRIRSIIKDQADDQRTSPTILTRHHRVVISLGVASPLLYRPWNRFRLADVCGFVIMLSYGIFRFIASGRYRPPKKNWMPREAADRIKAQAQMLAFEGHDRAELLYQRAMLQIAILLKETTSEQRVICGVQSRFLKESIESIVSCFLQQSWKGNKGNGRKLSSNTISSCNRSQLLQTFYLQTI